jgi:presenilin-like A22 family membrane protease
MVNSRLLGLLGLFLGAQVVALALAFPFKGAGLSSSSNPSSPTAPLLIIALIIIAPLFILWLVRRKGGFAALRYIILLGIAASLYLTLYETFSLFPPAPFYLPPIGAGILFEPAILIGGLISVGLLLALLMEPQWYVVDAAGFIAAGALIAILGNSFSILPCFILLIALLIYDAIAVYGTKHMVSLAEVVTDMKLPILMVMPSSTDYDYTSAPSFTEQRAKPTEEREAMFMGLGDVVIPGTLIVAAFIWLPSTPVVIGVGANLWAAIGALIGSTVGYLILMSFVMRGNPQAGLPLLNGGAIVGYAITYILLFRSLTLGLTGGL